MFKDGTKRFETLARKPQLRFSHSELMRSSIYGNKLVEDDDLSSGLGSH